MSSSQAALVAIAVLILLAACFVIGLLLGRERGTKPSAVEEPAGEPVAAEEEPQEAAEEVPEGPLAVDPHNPPYYSHYRPKRGYDPTTAPKCTCHQRTLALDQKVLIWPIPHHPMGGVEVLCEETYRKAKA